MGVEVGEEEGEAGVVAGEGESEGGGGGVVAGGWGLVVGGERWWGRGELLRAKDCITYTTLYDTPGIRVLGIDRVSIVISCFPDAMAGRRSSVATSITSVMRFRTEEKTYCLCRRRRRL